MACKKGPFIFKQMLTFHLASCYMYLYCPRIELDKKNNNNFIAHASSEGAKAQSRQSPHC